MEELFRFMMIRPPDPDIDVETVALDVPPEDEDFPEDDAISNPEDVPNNEELFLLRDRLVDTDGDDGDDGEDDDNDRSVDEIIFDVFGVESEELVESNQWDATRRGLDLGLIVGKRSAGEARTNLDRLAVLRRTIAIIETTAQEESLTKADVRPTLDAPFEIPGDIPNQEAVDAKEMDERIGALEEAASAFEAHKENIRAQLTEREALISARGELLAVPQSALETSVTNIDQCITDHSRAASPFEAVRSIGTRLIRNSLDRLGVIPESFLPESSISIDGDQEPRRGTSLSEEGFESLSPETQTILSESRIDPRNQPIEYVTEAIGRREARLRKQASNELDLIAPKSTVSAATAALIPTAGRPPIEFQVDADLQTLLKAADLGRRTNLSAVWTSFLDSLPFDCPPNPLRPAGIGQLYLVRQHLKRYEREDISHVENVLIGERRTREHTTRQTIEEFVLEETETERSEEKDLQTTDRFELSTEAQQTLQTEMAARGEVNITAKYGPAVTMEATAELAASRSRVRSNTVAQEFSQDVTERSVQRLTERVREQRTRRFVEEVEERNLHEFENDDEQNIVGVYQWLTKVYEAQVFDYGLRTLYDIVVPEPAAVYLSLLANDDEAPQPRISAPPELTISPADITKEGYSELVATYGATDVEAPPLQWISIAQSFSSARESEWRSARIVETDRLEIPDGYEAKWAAIRGSFSGTRGDPEGDDRATRIHVQIGRHGRSIDRNQRYHELTMANERGFIAVGVNAYKTSSFTVTIDIALEHTEDAVNKWKLETYQKIREAHDRWRSEYNAELSRIALETAEEAQIHGRGPGANEKLAMTELKRSAISFIANRRILLDAIDEDAADIAFEHLAMSRNNDPLIRFLEQAFEWENMTYVLYPYFWGRKDPNVWRDRVQYTDVDTSFADFIRAGAARIVLPVRPNFEGAVDHFITDCEPWRGGPLPTYGSPLYLPYVKEIKAQLGAPGNEVPVEQPWEVHVPTSLITLREDGQLPRWRRVEGEDWKWEEVPTGE